MEDFLTDKQNLLMKRLMEDGEVLTDSMIVLDHLKLLETIKEKCIKLLNESEAHLSDLDLNRYNTNALKKYREQLRKISEVIDLVYHPF